MIRNVSSSSWTCSYTCAGLALWSWCSFARSLLSYGHAAMCSLQGGGGWHFKGPICGGVYISCIFLLDVLMIHIHLLMSSPEQS